MEKWPRFLLAGDRGLLVEYGDRIDPEINKKIRDIFLTQQKFPIPGITETVPTYRSLLVFYDPMKTSPDRLQKEILDLETKRGEGTIPPPEVFEIPVVYGGGVRTGS